MNVSVYHDDHCVILRVLAVDERNSFSYGSSKSPVIGHMFVISGVCFEVKQDFVIMTFGKIIHASEISVAMQSFMIKA